MAKQTTKIKNLHEKCKLSLFVRPSKLKKGKMQEFFNSIPPVTKYLGAIIIGVALIVSVKLVDPGTIVFDPDLAFGKFQIWRFFTGLFFMGKISFNLILSIFFDLMMLRNLELAKFPTRHSQLVFVIILMGIINLTLSGIFGSYSCAHSLMGALMYFFGKMMPEARVYVMMFPVPAQWAPFINIIMAVAGGQHPIVSIIGILTGHIVFYLLYVLPVITDTPIFKTPRILVRYLD